MPAHDTFTNYTSGLSSPITDAEGITPNDGADLSHVTRAIYVGGTGNLRVTLHGGQTITMFNVSSGAIYPLRVTKVFATETTATGVIGFR